MGKGDMQGASQEKLRRDRGMASGATNSDPFGLIKCPHCDASLRRRRSRAGTRRGRRSLAPRYITKQRIRSASETFHLPALSYEMSREPLEIGSSRAFSLPHTHFPLSEYRVCIYRRRESPIFFFSLPPSQIA